MLNSDAVVQSSATQMQIDVGCVASPLYAHSLPEHSLLTDTPHHQSTNLQQQQQQIPAAFLPPIAFQQISMQQQMRMLSAVKSCIYLVVYFYFFNAHKCKIFF